MRCESLIYYLIMIFNLPIRTTNAKSGSEVINTINTSNVGHSIERDKLIEGEISTGNFPNFMRVIQIINFEKIIDSEQFRVTIYSLPDYLCIGSNSDFVYVPLNPMTFQIICDKFNAIIPTKILVDKIWAAATCKLNPEPMGPPKYPYNHSMYATDRFVEHSKWCVNQFNKKSYKQGCLTAGHKKDIVICESVQDPQPLNPRVAIYGWHQANGTPIQNPVQAKAHEITYRDYSHGERLISKIMMINEKQYDIIEILKDPRLYKLISDERLTNPRYQISV